MKKKILLILIILIIIIVGLFLFWNMKNNYQYKINYHDGYVPGNHYEIYIKKNYDMMIMKKPVCSTENCEKESKTTVSFKTESKKQLKQFLDDQFSNRNEITLEASELSQHELIIIESIIYNDETHLGSVAALKNVLFSITSSRLDCDSVWLDLYADNTYQYFDIMNASGEAISPKAGVYSYDISKIIEKNDQYETNDHGVYLITDSKKQTIEVYDTNQEFNQFLKSIQLPLDVCMQIK